MSVLGVYLPTWGRPHALKRVADNVAAATVTPYTLIFACECNDEDSIEEGRKWGRVVVNHDTPSYSNSLQVAYEEDDSPFFIGANDDFDFKPGWDTAALKEMRAMPWIRVVGIYDGNPSCDFSTISLIDRRYIEEQSGVIDMPNRVNYPYKHNYVDTEFHATAVARKVFRPCRDSVIVHRHPDWGYAEIDDTYRKSQASLSEDGHTFNSRAHLWTSLS